jgi:hypothetical protein
MGREVEILAGLTAGERVVAQGAGFLDDGDSVRVVVGEASGDLQRSGDFR